MTQLSNTVPAVVHHSQPSQNPTSGHYFEPDELSQLAFTFHLIADFP
jgi:hypothetical protein